MRGTKGGDYLTLFQIFKIKFPVHQLSRIYFINIPLSTFNNIYKFGGNYCEKKTFKHSQDFPQPTVDRKVTITSRAMIKPDV